ncbi:TSUP family transporter [Desulfobacterales bacterium HSG16]|nr:TSUP family transporter [Desulfobacterales bacterium HSG16]
MLFFAGLLAGFVDSIAGGGGLIALPALLFAGLPPQVALGTNKLQGSFGTLSAAFNYIRKGEASLKEAAWGIIFTLIGATAGAWFVQQLDPSFIRPLIPILLIFVFVYTIFSKNLGYEDRAAKLSQNMFFVLFGISLGFYDGFFGPGTGSFWTVGFMVFLGFNMTRASGFTKIMNFTSNIVALSMFVIGNNVYYSAGLTMALGQIIGANTGSNLAIKNGARFIRPVFLTVVFLTIIRLAYLNYFNGT